MTKEEARRQRLQEAYRKTFQGEDAALVIEDLKARACYDQPSFIPGLEPWQPSYRDGAKSITRYILEQIATIPNEPTTPTIIK